MTPEVAQRIVDFRADSETQNRIDELADKSAAGELTEAEASEYREFVDAIDLICVLQQNARRLLAESVQEQ